MPAAVADETLEDFEPELRALPRQCIPDRYYDPTTAQFITVDPLVAETESPYGYTADNPVNGTDPNGLLCIGSVCTRFDPMAGLRAAVNIGRGASFVVSDKIANWIQPGASCTVSHNGLDEAIGSLAADVALAGRGGDLGLGAEDPARAIARSGPSGLPNFEDPAVSPGDGWEWRGSGDPGSTKGSWYSPQTGERLHPDLGHPDPIGPHYDWTAPDGTAYRVYPDGRIVPK